MVKVSLSLLLINSNMIILSRLGADRQSSRTVMDSLTRFTMIVFDGVSRPRIMMLRNSERHYRMLRLN
jgi:hypothetical protein